MNISEENYLIKRLKEGDIRALEVLFNQHYSNLCRYLLLLFKNQLLVEHIAQDIFVYIWENREKIEIKTSIESYLYSAGRYKALNQIRNSYRHDSINKTLAESTSEEDISSDKLLEIKELESIIERAIQSLPERCQQIFRLSRQDEMTYPEIANLMNLSLSTVENQMGIALKKMRTALRPFYIQLFFLT